MRCRYRVISGITIHHGIVIVEHRGRIESPAGLAGLRRRVGPAVADQLVDAFEKMQVRLGLHVERRGAEHRRMQPRPRFRRSHRTLVEMARRRSPACGRSLPPLRAFAFGQIHQRVARKTHRRRAVSLRAEQRAMRLGPFADGRQVILVGQFGERLSPIVADIARSLGPISTPASAGRYGVRS